MLQTGGRPENSSRGAGCRAQLERSLLGGHLDGAWPPSSRDARRRLEHRVELIVGVVRVVVEQQRALGVRAAREAHRVAERRVAPADVARVLVVGVLAVVDQQVGVARERVAREPLRLELVERRRRAPARGRACSRATSSPSVDAEAERRAAVVDRLGADPRRPEVPLGGAGSRGSRARRAARAPRPGSAAPTGSARCRSCSDPPGRGRAPDRHVGLRRRTAARRTAAPGCGPGAGASAGCGCGSAVGASSPRLRMPVPASRTAASRPTASPARTTCCRRSGASPAPGAGPSRAIPRS